MKKLTLLLSSFFCLFSYWIVQAKENLNVLLVFVDDINKYIDLGPGKGMTYDNAQTPNLKNFAQHGVVFSNSYCSAPVCNPSRTSFIPGLYPAQTGVYVNKDPMFNNLKNRSKMVALPEHFFNNDYETYAYGKILHYAGPVRSEIGKTWTDAVLEGTDFTKPNPNLLKGSIKYKNNTFGYGVSSQDDDAWISVKNAKKVAAKMENLFENDTPFFILYGNVATHKDFIVPEKYYNEFANIKYPSHLNSGKNYRDAYRCYLASVKLVDHAFGILWEKIKQTEKLGSDGKMKKLLDETIVVFTSDHGFGWGEQGLYGKASLDRAAIEVPLIMSVPGKASGVSNKVISLLDIYPTLITMCDLPGTGKSYMGQDFSELFDDLNSQNYTGWALTQRKTSTNKLKTDGYTLTGNTLKNLMETSNVNNSSVLQKMKNKRTQLLKPFGAIIPPVANAGSDQTVVDFDNNGTETVTLDGFSSFDPDGNITDYIWKKGSAVIANGVSANVTLPIGKHDIILKVVDNDNVSGTNLLKVTVSSLSDDDDDDDDDNDDDNNDDNDDDDNNDDNDDNDDAVQLFSKKKYKGKKTIFNLGKYNNAAITAAGLNDNDAESVKILPGYKVTLYDGNEFNGYSETITKNKKNLGKKIKNKTSSIIVEKK